MGDLVLEKQVKECDLGAYEVLSLVLKGKKYIYNRCISGWRKRSICL